MLATGRRKCHDCLSAAAWQDTAFAASAAPVLRRQIWHHGNKLALPCPAAQTRFGCATDATRAGVAWGREAIDTHIAGQHDAEDAAMH